VGRYFQTQKAKVLRKASAAKAEPAARSLDQEQQNPVWQSLAVAPAALQTKLAIGRPDDPFEHEADRVADRVMQMASPVSTTGQTPVTASAATTVRRHSAARREEDDRILQRKPETSRQEEPQQRHRRRVSWATSAPAIVHHAVASRGESLDPATRLFMEQRFGHDFSDVRVHTDRQAEAAASQINARAFTVGRDIVFAADEYSPSSAGGRRLLAHELTHVVQQTGAPGEARSAPLVGTLPANIVQRIDGPLDQLLQDEIQFWRDEAELAEGLEDYGDYAYCLRVLLLFQGIDGDSFADEIELQFFIDDAVEDALSEDATLARVGELGLMITQAFPLIWSDRVYDALYLEYDRSALNEEKNQKQLAMQRVADRVTPEVSDIGLPVPYAEARSLREFHLLLRHVNLDREHVVKDMAIANRDYGIAGWTLGFYTMWNAMAEMFADRVAEGTLVVNYGDYTDFVATRQEGLRALGQRIGTVTTEELMHAFDDDVVNLTHVAFISSVASALLGLVPAFMYWSEGLQLFDEKMLAVDALISSEASEDKILRAFRWAHESGYFGAAGEEIWNNILAHGWEILRNAAIIIAAQYIPYLNVALDFVLIAYAGVDILSAVYDLYQAFAVVSTARTAVALQSASARMAASVTGDSLRALLDVLAITASLRGIKTNVDRLRRAGMSEEEAIRRALREATGEEAAALRSALARRRIRAQFDPHGILDDLLNQGVNAEIVEQALISGMTPSRLTSLVHGISDIGRIEAIIRYAGNYSSPINALIDAGMPASRVGDMLNLRFGLRELRACDIVLQRTGDVAQVEGLITTLGRFGADGVAQLIRLTPEGLASVYQAGGEAAMQVVLDTIALEGSGLIVGFDQWVTFTIRLMNKQGRDLLNALGELREAQRVAQTLTGGQRVRLGGDLAPGRSFDIVIEDAAGNVVRNIEVTTAVGTLESFRDLSQGIRHAIDKVAAAAGGTAEATIRVTIRPSTSIGRGRTRVMNPDGTFHIVERDGSIHTRGSVLADTARNLPSITGSNQLSRVHVVNMDGTLVGTLENRGGTWVVL
jgi:hypothetical protein